MEKIYYFFISLNILIFSGHLGAKEIIKSPTVQKRASFDSLLDDLERINDEVTDNLLKSTKDGPDQIYGLLNALSVQNQKKNCIQNF